MEASWWNGFWKRHQQLLNSQGFRWNSSSEMRWQLNKKRRQLTKKIVSRWNRLLVLSESEGESEGLVPSDSFIHLTKAIIVIS